MELCRRLCQRPSVRLIGRSRCHEAHISTSRSSGECGSLLWPFSSAMCFYGVPGQSDHRLRRGDRARGASVCIGARCVVRENLNIRSEPGRGRDRGLRPNRPACVAQGLHRRGRLLPGDGRQNLSERARRSAHGGPHRRRRPRSQRPAATRSSRSGGWPSPTLPSSSRPTFIISRSSATT